MDYKDCFCAASHFQAQQFVAESADTIKVSRNESDTLVIIVKEKPSIDRQARKELKLTEKIQRLSCRH